MTEPITETNAYGIDGLVQIEHDDLDAIRALLLGHRVKRFASGEADHIELDNGTVIRVIPNDGGCSCSAGDYEIHHLTTTDNVITHVELFDDLNDQFGEGHTYRVFVVAADTRFNLLTVDGSDGSGYYGTGYRLLVRS